MRTDINIWLHRETDRPLTAKIIDLPGMSEFGPRAALCLSDGESDLKFFMKSRADIAALSGMIIIAVLEQPAEK